MPDIKFSQLEVVTSVASNDSIPIIDASNPLMSENGSNAIISVGDFADSLFGGLSDGALSSSKIQTNPTFTGDVTLPSTTTIGDITGVELNFLSGLRDNVQYQLDNIKIGTTENLPLITTTGGIITTGSFGTGANTFCAGNDPRIANLHAVIDTSASTLTLTEADNNEYIRCSAAGGTAITLDGSGAWTVGMTVTLRRTTSAGACTLTATNATINDNDIANVLAGDTFALKCVDITSPANKIFDFIN